MNGAVNRIMAEIWASPHWPEFTWDAAAAGPDLAAASEAVGETAGLIQGLQPDEQEDLQLRQIVQEAIASFGIEGVALDPAEVVASVVASLKHRGRAGIARRSDAVAALMLEARSSKSPMDAETLCAWHRLLFTGMEVEDLGRWRSFGIEIIRSAAAGSNDAHYTAPPPERVAAEMARFFAWLNAPQDQPVAVKAAIAHLWFDSIHPFSDGNGRIGRALIEHVFAGSRALPFSFSRQVERDKKAYYAALQAGRQEGQGGIDATPFVIWFLETLKRAATAAQEEARFILARNRFFLRHGPQLNPRQEKALRMLFDQGPERLAQGLRAKSYRKMTGAAPATATRDLRALEEAGLLTRSAAGGRSTAYSLRL